MTMWIWIMLAVAVGAAVWWIRRPRRTRTLGRIRVELHEACVVEDRVVDAVWRAAISMTNTSWRPRGLPVFAEKATVKVGWRRYLATVYLDTDVAEINPDDVALAWVEFVAPAGRRLVVEVVQLRPRKRARRMRFVGAGERAAVALQDSPDRGRVSRDR